MRTQRQFGVSDGDFHPTWFAYSVNGHPNATVHYDD